MAIMARVYFTLYFLVFFLDKYFVDIGFALKPFFVLNIITFTLIILKRVKISFLSHDFAFTLFLAFYILTSMWAENSLLSLRMTLGISLLFFTYITLRYTFKYIDSELLINKILFNNAYTIFVCVSFLLYIAGMLILDGKFLEYNSNDILGVTVDRLIPRMTGTTTDPNFLVLYMTPLFFYLFAKKDKRAGEKLLFLLSIVTIALTLSRGGIISILLTLVLYKISKALATLKITISRNFITKSIFIIGIIGTSLVLFLTLAKTPIGNDIEHMLLKRFNLSSLQRASGRFYIWRNGFLLFRENPLLGIGVYNFIYYNSNLFGDYHYMHNTHLEVLVESGIVGFSLYVIFHLMLLYSIYKLQRTRRHVHVFLIYVSMQLQMTSLSAIINPVWILFLAYTSFVIEKELKKEKRRV